MGADAWGSRGRSWRAVGAAALAAVAAAALVLLGGRYSGTPAWRPGAVRADDPRLFYSPWAWYDDGPACQTTHFGASIRFGWTGRSLRLDVDVSMWDRARAAAGSYPEIGCAIDDLPVGVVRLAPGSTSCTLVEGMPEGRHRALVYLRRMGFDAERWRYGGQVALWRVTGLTLDPGATVFAWPGLRPRRALFFGDSILDGAFNLGADTDSLRSWAEVAAERLGAEPGRVGFEGQSYAIDGNTTNGNVPALFAPGDRRRRTWDKLDSRHSRLAAGRFSPVPDLVFLCHGANDAVAKVPGARVRASVEGLLPEIRRASGTGASVFVVVPFEGFHRASIREAFDAYQSATPDPRCHLIDLGDAARVRVADVEDGKPARRSYDGLHPNAPMHERLGVMVADEVRRRLSGR